MGSPPFICTVFPYAVRRGIINLCFGSIFGNMGKFTAVVTGDYAKKTVDYCFTHMVLVSVPSLPQQLLLSVQESTQCVASCHSLIHRQQDFRRIGTAHHRIKFPKIESFTSYNLRRPFLNAFRLFWRIRSTSVFLEKSIFRTLCSLWSMWLYGVLVQMIL